MSYALRENGDGTCNATRKQMSYLKALMAEVYSEEQIEVFVGDGLTKAEASDAIGRMKDAGVKTERERKNGGRTNRRSRRSNLRREFEMYADLYGEYAAIQHFGRHYG